MKSSLCSVARETVLPSISLGERCASGAVGIIEEDAANLWAEEA